uniref:Uncharacterized protein n=1 Tax=Timema douglasi TaxID=61478 RepID=A0A7R8VAR4_TIMDO|nr:unnamed protein product [Timema douglasi]
MAMEDVDPETNFFNSEILESRFRRFSVLFTKRCRRMLLCCSGSFDNSSPIQVRLTATGCVLWFPLIPTPWLLTAASTPPSPLGEPPSEGDTPAAVVYSAGVTTSPSPSAGVGGGTMIMDGGLDALTPHHHHQSHPHHHHAFLLTENAAAAGHFNVLSFDTLYKEPPGGGGAASASPATPEPTPVGVEGEEAAQPGDLNTPVTTSGDIPSFFGPSTVVEPPPITVKWHLEILSSSDHCWESPKICTYLQRK